MSKKSLIICLICMFSNVFALSIVDTAYDLKKIVNLVDKIVTSKPSRRDLENVLIVFGMNNTICFDPDYFVRFCFEDRFADVLKTLCTELNINYDEEGKAKERLLSKIINLSNEYVALVDDGILDLLRTIKRNGMKSLVLTHSIFGKYGEIDNFADFKIRRINKLGVEFDSFWFKFRDKLSKRFDGVGGRACFDRGFLFCGERSQGESLATFFDELKWYPGLIAVVSDSVDEINDVKLHVSLLYSQRKIEPVFLGFTYLAMKKVGEICDMNIINYQVATFLKSGMWIREIVARDYSLAKHFTRTGVQTKVLPVSMCTSRSINT